ncbi:MAG: SsrA-binding protein SmpB [Planctomycetes bacterium]|jgi:SsrA-binding protein|nr:SsrA-binding protein SmpB [Planctomycetota bacterium]
MAAKPAAKDPKAADKPVEILYNRKLRHDFEVIDSWEAGMILMGSEAKSLRAGDVQWAQAHARFDERTGELWLYNLHIGEYRQAGIFGHQAGQPRQLLLKKRELEKLRGQLAGKGLTVVPERLLFRRGWAKVAICLCRGKDRGDRRQDLLKRAQQRDVQREMARRLRGK